MIGAIIGDIVGSVYEFHNHRSKDFLLFKDKCFPTDDTIMTIAVARALMDTERNGGNLSKNTVKWMQNIGRNYPFCGYGGRFYDWIYGDDPQPYNSFGNGAAMRVSALVDMESDFASLIQKTITVTSVSHNHPEGIKGALATVTIAYMAKQGLAMNELVDIAKLFYARDFLKTFTVDRIRPRYYFNETCQETVPQALEAFFESDGFEDAIRNAISVGGDSDTLAAITGTVAEAYYGVPRELKEKALSYLDFRLRMNYDFFDLYLKRNKKRL